MKRPCCPRTSDSTIKVTLPRPKNAINQVSVYKRPWNRSNWSVLGHQSNRSSHSFWSPAPNVVWRVQPTEDTKRIFESCLFLSGRRLRTTHRTIERRLIVCLPPPRLPEHLLINQIRQYDAKESQEYNCIGQKKGDLYGQPDDETFDTEMIGNLRV